MARYARCICAFFLTGIFAASALAGPLEDGMVAYQEKDYLKAIQLWRPLAQAGDAEAQYRLGVMYAEGRGVAPNDAEAALWFERAAEQGEPMAQYNLGASYAEGSGRAQGHGHRSQVVPPRGRPGCRARATQPRIALCEWRRRSAGQRRGAQMDRSRDLRAAGRRGPFRCGEGGRRCRRQDECRRNSGCARPRARMEGEARGRAEKKPDAK